MHVYIDMYRKTLGKKKLLMLKVFFNPCSGASRVNYLLKAALTLIVKSLWFLSQCKVLLSRLILSGTIIPGLVIFDAEVYPKAVVLNHGPQTTPTGHGFWYFLQLVHVLLNLSVA